MSVSRDLDVPESHFGQNEEQIVCLCAENVWAVEQFWRLRMRAGVRLCVALLLPADTPVPFTMRNNSDCLILHRSSRWRWGEKDRLCGVMRTFLQAQRPDFCHLVGAAREFATVIREEKLPFLYSPGMYTTLLGAQFGFFLHRRERRLLHTCLALVVTSDLQEEVLLARYHADPGRILVVPAWVESPQDDELHSRIFPDAVALLDSGRMPSSASGHNTVGSSVNEYAIGATPAASERGGLCGAAGGAAAREALGIPQDSPVVGFVWPVNDFALQQRYFEMSVRLSRLVKGVRILVAGVEELPPVFGKQLTHELRERPLFVFASNLCNTGDLAKSDFSECYRRFYLPLDVFVHCGQRWQTPDAVLQAIVRGVAVVGEDCPGLQAALVHNETGMLVSGGGWSVMASAVAGILENPELGARIGAWSGLAARENFSQVAAEKTCRRLYASVAHALRQKNKELIADIFYRA